MSFHAALGEDIVWCPGPGCGYGQITIGGRDEPSVQCGNCGLYFCSVHGVPWGPGACDCVCPDPYFWVEGLKGPYKEHCTQDPRRGGRARERRVESLRRERNLALRQGQLDPRASGPAERQTADPSRSNDLGQLYASEMRLRSRPKDAPVLQANGNYGMRIGTSPGQLPEQSRHRVERQSGDERGLRPTLQTSHLFQVCASVRLRVDPRLTESSDPTKATRQSESEPRGES